MSLKLLARQGLAYGLVGVLALVVDWGCFVLLTWSGMDTLPANARATHVSLFDGTLQGMERTDKPAFCFQGHPEASPGPHDVSYLFDRFVNLMRKHKKV